MNTVAFRKRYNRLLKFSNNKDLTEYIDIINDDNNKTTIKFDRLPDGPILYEIDFYRKVGIENSNIVRNNYIGLPMELNEIIADFMIQEYKLTLFLKQEINDHYPYVRSSFSYISHNTNIITDLDLPEYYKYLCVINNELEWLPSIELTKEILMFFFTQLNTIDYIINPSFY